MTPEEKKLKKQEEFLEKYKVAELSNAADIASIRNIACDLAGSGLIEFGSFLSGDDKVMLRVLVQYQRALMEQNFILIRQLDRIAKSQKAIVQLMKKAQT